MKRIAKIWLYLFASLALAGCTGLSASWDRPPPSPPPVAASPVPAPAPASPAPEPVLHPAAAVLHMQAIDAADQGQYDQAAALLERALRIAPSHAQLWYDLAQVHQGAGQLADAEQFAIRAIDLATGWTRMLRLAWQLLATIREQRGDVAGRAAALAQLAAFDTD